MQRHLKDTPLFIFALMLLVVFSAGMAHPNTVFTKKQGNWWNIEPEEENPSRFYDSILYSEIAPRLRDIEKRSNRVKVEVIGQSAGGRNLYLVTLSDPKAMGRLGKYQAIRRTMLTDPEKAQEMIDKFGDFKVPVFINGSIHGNEYPGVDAAIRLIETLAFGESDEVKMILENVILLVNVVQNPDGRVLGIRANANGIDLNRDFISQTQPETRATVELITEWNPMVFLDLHDDVQPMLIEPCSPPHNPNYEYDLYIKWALFQAYAMETELVNNTDETEALIPFRDWDFTDIGWSWDDWPPIYTPMYAMYHGAYGHTLETPYEDERGVDADYWAVWGALKFAAINKAAMVRDQVEIFKRGFLAMPQQLIPAEILAETPYDQFNELTIQEFPAAYIIPQNIPLQISSHQPARLVDFLLFNDVQVEQTSLEFSFDGTVYPAGTYLVWMDQPKRGLANALLEEGMDVSNIEGIEFYSPPTAWSHPLLWGADAVRMEEKVSVETSAITKADAPEGSFTSGHVDYYGYETTSLAAFQATNSLLARGFSLMRNQDNGAIFFARDDALIDELSGDWALDIFPVAELPENYAILFPLKIAINDDPGLRICLDEMGFSHDTVSIDSLNNGDINNYDVLINNSLTWSGLNKNGKDTLDEWLAAGGDYIGLLEAGAKFAKAVGIIDYQSHNDNSADGILRLDYTSNSITTGFRDKGYGYVLGAMWFTEFAEETEVIASIAPDDFLVSGYWPDWETSDAAGMPVVLSQDNGAQDTTLIGFDATFRGHPKDTFRLVGNAIYAGLESVE